jgi:pilus assembly protein Flp/PilA
MEATVTNFKKMMNDEAGASAAEYALIIAIIGVAMGLAAIALGDQITASISGAAGEIETVRKAS